MSHTKDTEELIKESGAHKKQRTIGVFFQVHSDKSFQLNYIKFVHVILIEILIELSPILSIVETVTSYNL